MNDDYTPEIHLVNVFELSQDLWGAIEETECNPTEAMPALVAIIGRVAYAIRERYGIPEEQIFERMMEGIIAVYNRNVTAGEKTDMEEDYEDLEDEIIELKEGSKKERTDFVIYDATCNECGHKWEHGMKRDQVCRIRCLNCKSNKSIGLRER